MAIVATDIQTRLSGGAANTNPNLSLGGVMSSTAWTGGTLQDLFDVITGDENAASTVDFRAIYIRNNHATLTWLSPMLWLSAQTPGGADIAIGLDPAAAGNGSTTGVGATIPNETTAPSGVAFSAPTTKATGLAIGDLAPGQGRMVWIRRTATNSAAINSDGATLSFEGDTTA